jgi:hypothetical protein
MNRGQIGVMSVPGTFSRCDHHFKNALAFNERPQFLCIVNLATLHWRDLSAARPTSLGVRERFADFLLFKEIV